MKKETLTKSGIRAAVNAARKNRQMSEEAEFLLQQGREHRKSGRIDEAIENFARAVELKMQKIDSEMSPLLADFLVEYADSLLVKEETDSTSFLGHLGHQSAHEDVRFVDEAGIRTRLDSALLEDVHEEDIDDNDNLSDIQLAWESFEHAKLCLMSDESACDTSNRRFKQLSFIHCRLGDIQALQGQYLDSISDYGVSIDFAIKGQEASRKIAGLIVSLCQTIQVLIMSSDEYKSLVVADSDDVLKNLDSRIRKVFQSVAAQHGTACPVPPSDPEPAKLVPLLARDGFLLANTLLEQSMKQGTCEKSEIQSSIDEIAHCVDECVSMETLNSDKSIPATGFSAPSSDNASVVVVPVKRKVAPSDTNEPPSKQAKDDDENRADKARIVD